MIVSWNWLKEYVSLDMPVEEFQRRLMLAGLNHERTTPVGGDLAIDLEVTSNRPDCLGHLGIAREAAVIWDRPLRLPPAEPPDGGDAVERLARVSLACPALCARYTARVIRGVKVRPSPAWLTARLATLGIAPVNNVVDITNYVLMECGQPLHAFDLARLDGREIIVREARSGEPFTAIDHKPYELSAGMCVIADRSRAVGLGGVMGGAETEISHATTEVLLEAADFDPISIRNTARRLNLHSDSSYRFERGLDPNGVDWASRRACQLILDMAGGELAAGLIDVGRRPGVSEPVVLRYSQLKRVLGIDVPRDLVRRILKALGNEESQADGEQVHVIPPSWRRDLSREIDLVEEVARIHGYDAIPEDVSVPMATSSRTHQDRVLALVRQSLVACGIDEALTPSAVEEGPSAAFSPWTDEPPLVSGTPILRRADRLRRSLVPSLLLARRANESLANPRIELYEIAKVYLPRKQGLPIEEWMLALTSGEDFSTVKGVLETIVARLNPASELQAVNLEASRPGMELFAQGKACELRLEGERLGWLGEVGEQGRKQFELRVGGTVAEIKLSLLSRIARLAPQAVELSLYPAVERDLNLVVAEQVLWADVAATVRQAAGPDLERLEFQDTYRDRERIGEGRKSLLFTIVLRRDGGTLTAAEADQARDAVVAACGAAHAAKLRA